MDRRKFVSVAGAGMAGGIVLPSVFPMTGLAGAKEKAKWNKPRETYKCLYNLEMNVMTYRPLEMTDYTTEWITSFPLRLQGTNVDAVMCCPTMWRTNMFPSEADPWWKDYKTGTAESGRHRSYNYLKKYIFEGGDPVKETLEACRKINVDFYISYRMNDWHQIGNKNAPTHNPFWREHPQYWLGDTDAGGTSDSARLLNYMIPEVRDHYFSVIEELCTKYDVDGVELDFLRAPRFFYEKEISQGIPVMTSFVKRIREMMNRVGDERGKYLKFCVRVHDTPESCEKVGLDVIDWDSKKYLDMINISNFYDHNPEIGIEDFRGKTKNSKLFGEMQFITNWKSSPEGKTVNSLTTAEIYRATALSYFARGVDGISLFNTDFIPSKQRGEIIEMLKSITDLNALKNSSKNYALYPNHYVAHASFPATDEKTFDLFIADDVSKVKFSGSLLRLETKERCDHLTISLKLNGEQLKETTHDDIYLFEPLIRLEGFIDKKALKFYEVPLSLIRYGNNRIEIKNLDKEKASCRLYSLELALYRNDDLK
jgi:hypothetical protein